MYFVDSCRSEPNLCYSGFVLGRKLGQSEKVEFGFAFAFEETFFNLDLDYFDLDKKGNNIDPFDEDDCSKKLRRKRKLPFLRIVHGVNLNLIV